MLIQFWKVSAYIILNVGIWHFAQAQEWKLATNKKGVTVYTRQSDDSPVKEFKAVTKINATVNRLVMVITDFETYGSWYDRCEYGKLIRKNSEGALIYHTMVTMPFPFKDRDLVMIMRQMQANDGVLIKFTRIDHELAEIEGVVRMPISEGSWILTPDENGSTNVIHQFKGDPGGNVPSAIINMFLVGGPINTLTNLKAYLNE